MSVDKSMTYHLSNNSKPMNEFASLKGKCLKAMKNDILLPPSGNNVYTQTFLNELSVTKFQISSISFLRMQRRNKCILEIHVTQPLCDFLFLAHFRQNQRFWPNVQEHR